MTDLRVDVLGGEVAPRWVQVVQEGAETFRWIRMTHDAGGTVEEESKKAYSSRAEAEEAAAKAKGNEGLEIRVGPNPDHWEQQSAEEIGRRGGRSIPTGRA